jgi:hypothetical protein
LGYLGLAWASKVTGTRSSERVRARAFLIFFVKFFEFIKKNHFFFFFFVKASNGFETILVYCHDIFDRIDVALTNEFLTILIQVSVTLGYLISIPLCTILSKKSQFILSGSLMSSSFALITLLDSSFTSIRPAQDILMNVFFMAYGLGVGPVLFSLNGEIFPVEVKEVCTSIVLAWR